jgi:zinc protease
MEALYPVEHPYSRSTLGNRETLRALSTADLSRFHRAFYHPQTTILSVVGAVDAARVLDKLAATVGQWRVATPPVLANVPPAATPPTVSSRRIELPGKAQADLIWGVVGLRRSSPDYYAGMMANLVLGRLGLMGRLGAAVRDDAGLAYYVTSSLHAGRGPHPWDIVAGVNPQNAERAVAAILHEVERVREELISTEELDDCRSFLSGSLPLRLETSEGIAEILLAIEEHGLGLDYLQRYDQLIGRVTREDVQRVVRQYLTLDRYVLSMAGTFS